MRHLKSDFPAWEESFSEEYVVKFSLYSKLGMCNQMVTSEIRE